MYFNYLYFNYFTTLHLLSKMEGKTNFPRRLKHFWWLDLTDPNPPPFTTDLRHCRCL